MSKLFLTLDQGGSSSRAIVFNGRGELIHGVKVPVATARPQPQWVEQDPIEVVKSLRCAAEQVVAWLRPEQQNNLVSCGLVCQRSSLVCWDSSSGEPLSPVISWQDTRASQWLASQCLDSESIYHVTGLYPNAHFGVSKMHWCLHNNTAVIAAANKKSLRIAPLATYLVCQLLEEQPFLVDPVNASRTLLMNLDLINWDSELLNMFGIDQRFLPEIVATESAFGTLNIHNLSIPVNLLSGDQSAAAFADGEPEDDSCYVNIGTGAFIYRNTRRFNKSSRLLNSVLHWEGENHPPRYINEGTVNGAGAALQWFASRNGIDNLDTYLQNMFKSSADDSGGLGSSGLCFINGIGGLGSPDWVADFSSRFVGKGDDQDKIVAIVESIIFLICRNFLLINDDNKVHHMVITGGLSKSDWICQHLCDLLSISLIRPADCEASARGLAFLLAGKPNDWKKLDQQHFNPCDNKGLHSRYKQWEDLMLVALSRHG